MPLPNYTDEEWGDLERQVAASIEEHGIEWVATDLRRALSERRRVRYGALNGLALIAYIDSLLVAAEDRAGEVAFRGEEHVAELEREASK